MCDSCEARGTCPFYEAGANECVYDAFARMAQTTREKK